MAVQELVLVHVSVDAVPPHVHCEHRNEESDELGENWGGWGTSFVGLDPEVSYNKQIKAYLRLQDHDYKNKYALLLYINNMHVKQL